MTNTNKLHLDNLRNLLETNGVKTLHAYSRKSRDVDGEGLAKHHAIITELANQLGYPISFFEEVESSETLNRPMLNQLRKDIGAKRVKALIVYRLDRLSRKVTDTERLVREFAFNGLILIEAHREQVVNYQELLGIKLEAMMSDLYQEQAKLVLHAGRKKSVQLFGNHLGEVPLGYRYNKDTKKLEPDDQALTIQEIFNLYLKGYSTHKIAHKMNERGFTSKKGNPFNGKTIWSILHNEKYKGVQTYGSKEWYKDVDNRVLVKDRPQSEWIVYPSAHEPLIDPETFDKVQQLLEKGRTVPTGRRDTHHILTGLVKCGKCGKTMNLIKRSSGAVNVRSCCAKDYLTGITCGNTGAKGELVEAYIVNQLFTVVRPSVLQLKKQLAKGGKTAKQTFDDGELKSLQKQERELVKQLDKLIDMQLLHTTDRITVRMQQVEAQLSILKDRIIQVQGQDQSEQQTWVDHFMKDAEEMLGFPFNYRSLADEDKNLFLKRYVKGVTVLDRQIVGIQFVEEIEKLFSFTVADATEEIEPLTYNENIG